MVIIELILYFYDLFSRIFLFIMRLLLNLKWNFYHILSLLALSSLLQGHLALRHGQWRLYE